MEYIRKLPEVGEIQQEYSLTEEQRQGRKQRITMIQDLLEGKCNKKLLIVGPCSADNEIAVLDYVSRLARVQENVKDKFIIVPRIYTSKPRTNGLGYKGILHNPNADAPDDLLKGIIATRRLHLKVVQETGLYAADEMLYPDEMYYIMDILCYMAVGARSVENQGHRMVAAGVEVPVGLKNPTAGHKTTLVNSILAAQSPHHMIYRGWEVKCDGNPYAHAVLRGFCNEMGKNVANYHYEDICELHDLVIRTGIKNPGVVVDCNHANSGKNYIEQIRIANEICNMCSSNKELKKFIKGLMIESYIEDGSQIVGGGIYGKSITDPCLGWNKTEKLIYDLAEAF